MLRSASALLVASQLFSADGARLVASRLAQAQAEGAENVADTTALSEEQAEAETVAEVLAEEQAEVESSDNVEQNFMVELEAEDAEGYGHLLGANGTAEGPIQNWPSELDENYAHMQKLGCGANSCAFLARRLEDNKVMVVKVNAKSLAVECGWMRAVRVEACPNQKARKLLESYVPTCDDVGQTKNGLWYLAQPMAGDDTMDKKVRNGNHGFSDKDAKKIAAQLVAALYAMHSVGFWHNDLNGANIILDRTKVSLIDLGLVSTTACRTQRCKGSYSRDGNALFRWLAELAKCPSNARWDHSHWWRKAPLGEQRQAQNRALDCIKKSWDPDHEFMKALEKVFDANAREALPEQHIKELYDTKFVKKNLPRNDERYRIKQTSFCQHWNGDKLREKAAELGCVTPRNAVNGGLY